jgi:hypothetical protein
MNSVDDDEAIHLVRAEIIWDFSSQRAANVRCFAL